MFSLTIILHRFFLSWILIKKEFYLFDRLLEIYSYMH